MGRERQARLAALRVAAIYAGVGIVWIVATDALLYGQRFCTPLLQSLKGAIYVLFTALLLYLLVARESMRQARDSDALAAREAEWRELFQANPNPMWIDDAETKEFLAVNDAMVEKYGWTAEELLRLRTWDLESGEPLTADSVPAGSGLLVEPGSVILDHHTASGTRLLVQAISHPLVFEGRSAEFVLAEDVTGRLATARALDEARQRFEAIFETSPLPLIVVSPQAHVVMWSPAAERTFGWTAAEVLGNRVPIVPDERMPEMKRVLERTMSGSGVVAFETQRIRKDGVRLDVLVHSAPFHTPDSPDGAVLAILTDVTEIKRIERELSEYRVSLEQRVSQRTAELESLNDQLERATAAKSLFLANISHDLRTPLNSIIGFSGTMLQELAGPLTDEQRTQLEMVNKAGLHLLSLINDLLDISKIEAGKMTLALHSLDLSEVAEEVANLIQPQALEKGLIYELHVAGPAPVVADRTRVHQILSNLIGNAVRFTTEGSIRIEVTVGDATVRVSVTDTGPGIAPENAEIIFDEFRQVLGAAEGRGAGTGLGLAISRRLARMHGGDIELESAPGAGARFTLVLPKDAHEGEAPSATNEADDGSWRTADEGVEAS